MLDIRRGVCPLCGHKKIVQGWPTDHGYASSWPVSAAESQPNWRGKITTYGTMCIFVCQSCGFTQWFTAEPAAIPIGDEFQTRLIEGA